MDDVEQNGRHSRDEINYLRMTMIETSSLKMKEILSRNRWSDGWMDTKGSGKPKRTMKRGFASQIKFVLENNFH